MTIFDRFTEAFGRMVEERGLLGEPVAVRVKPLTTEEAIGRPERDDFPLMRGKERIVEAEFRDSKGHAFTDAPKNFSGTLAELLSQDTSDRFNAPMFVAAANAVLRHQGMIERTVHCRDDEPTRCAGMLVEYLLANHPDARRIALVGLQPAMAQALVDGGFELAVLDLDADNIGYERAGVIVKDGATELWPTVAGSDLVLATGSTLCNNTVDGIIEAAGDRPVVLFGVSIAGAAQLLGLERFCPLGH